MNFLHFNIIGAPKKFKHPPRPSVRSSSLKFGQNFCNLSHEKVPLKSLALTNYMNRRQCTWIIGGLLASETFCGNFCVLRRSCAIPAPPPPPCLQMNTLSGLLGLQKIMPENFPAGQFLGKADINFVVLCPWSLVSSYVGSYCPLWQKWPERFFYNMIKCPKSPHIHGSRQPSGVQFFTLVCYLYPASQPLWLYYNHKYNVESKCSEQ